MTEPELLALIKQHEADGVEFTQSRDKTDKFAEAVCAFANDLPGRGKPGFLIIGVADNGAFDGHPIGDELLRNLAGLREDGNIQPLPSLTVEKLTTTKGDVAVVTVQPAAQPPVRYKGRVHIRIGPRRGMASEQDEQALIDRRVSAARTFDAEPCLESTLDDLALPLFEQDYRNQAVAREIIEENHRDVPLQLASLRFYDQRRQCPTNAGIILFAKDVRSWLRGAYVQFLRIDGTTLADDVINDQELSGDLLTLLRELDALLVANLVQYPVAIDRLRERNVEAWPQVAVRELLMNAIMHRDYRATAPLRLTWFNDRIEIQSPGALYGEANAKNFPKQNSYRNPVIAEAMKVLGYVNRFGRGIIRAREALERNGSRPPDFLFDAGYVLATIWRRP